MLKAVVLTATVAAGAVTKTRSANATPVGCFLKGTRILTTEGERNIEDLAIGDLLPTVFGGTRPVQWIMRYRLTRPDLSKPWIDAAKPIRVARSALAENVPNADLIVTRHHALLIDGVLVQAEQLVNGTTIAFFDPGECDEIELLNIKFAAHDVLYAGGAACESQLGVEEKANNFAGYLRTYGPMAADEKPCAPSVGYWNGRSALKSRVRSAMSPWIDRRDTLDVIRDRLEERSVSLSQRSELVS